MNSLPQPGDPFPLRWNRFLRFNSPTDERCEEIHGEDYYWYLSSPEFVSNFISTIGTFLISNQLSCLDIGCGAGPLGQYLNGTGLEYLGIDASPTAIEKAKDGLIYDYIKYEVARLESYQTDHHYDVVVFGGILEVMVKEEQRMALIQHYANMVRARYVIIYDLMRLDTTDMHSNYNLVSQHFGDAGIQHLEPYYKNERKIEIYSC